MRKMSYSLCRKRRTIGKKDTMNIIYVFLISLRNLKIYHDSLLTPHSALLKLLIPPGHTARLAVCRGAAPLFKSYRYARPQRVWFLSCFGVIEGIDFDHFGLK